MKQILKNQGNPVIMLVIVLIFFSCEKHDFIDKNAITGNVGPQAYWEIASSTVSAGADVAFDAQYYSTVADIDHAEVWYNIVETEEKNVSCTWATTFTYSISSIISKEQRISQKIKEYPHSLAVWSDSLHAYFFENTFPVSGTLKSFAWSKPDAFDTLKMETYFGVGYMQHFKDSLYNLMKYADFKNLILGLSLRSDFKQYTDSTQDINAGENVFVYHFPKGSIVDIKVRDTLWYKPGDYKDIVNGDTIWVYLDEIKEIRRDTTWTYPIPEAITNIYNDSIPFDKLVSGASGYNVEYKRTYSLNANLRVYDKKGTYGTTVTKKIDIN